MKISPILIVLKTSQAAVNYEVTSCNDADKTPELSFQINEEFYNKWNFDESDMAADGHGYLTKTVPASDLHFQIHDDQYWSLTYSITSSAEIVGPVVLAKEFSVDLNCIYPRMLSTASNTTVTHPDFGPNTGVGEYEYIATVTDSEVGERTEVSIAPRHSLPQIRASVTECEVSFGEQKIFPVHSMHYTGQTCTDSRLNTIMEYGVTDTDQMQTINFSYNSFLFVDDENSDQQELTLTCQLQVFGEDGFTTPAMSDCGCYTEDECSRRFCVRVVSDNTVEHWSGDEVKLLVNDVEIETALNHEGLDQTTCLEINDDDQVTLQRSGDDGVFIKEIWVNDELTSISSFWLDGDNDLCAGSESYNMGMMSTQSITLSKTGDLIGFHPYVGCCEHILYTSACDDNVIFDMPQEVVISPSNLVTDGFYVPELYEISFDMKLLPDDNRDWRSILHVTTGNDMTVCGDRQPALWVEHGTEADIHMTHCVGANIDYYVHKAYTAPIGQWINFKIGVMDDGTGHHFHYIIIDGNEVVNQFQPNRNRHENMMMYVGDPWYDSASGSLKNIRLTDHTM